MTVRRFFGETAREALRKVKTALGPEAIVISNKSVPGGVEIMAMSADSLAALQAETAPAPAAPAPAKAMPTAAEAPAPQPRSAAGAVPPAPTFDEEEVDDYAVTLSTKARAPQAVHAWQPWQPPRHETPAATPAEKPKLRPLPPRQNVTEDVPGEEQVAAVLAQASATAGATVSAPAKVDSPLPGGDLQVQQLMDEMRAIKTLLERQLAGFAWGDLTRHAPVRAQLLGEMLEAGFSGQLARRLAEELPESLDVQEGRKWLGAAVNRRLRTLSSDNDLIDQGGVFALVGPTGVGKTTTTAKLAARCVVRYGADKLALLTTDGYRIGAHEQLRIYGRILGVPVHVVRDSEDLRRMLAELSGKHMVLIDTVGMSQRDRMVAEQAAMLMRAGDVKRLLLLNATSRGDTLDDVIKSYAGEDIAGCILSKVDETAALAPALDAVVRHGLLLTYIANGQRVPEDLHLPNRAYLLHRAFKLPAPGSVHRLRNDELGLIMPTPGESRAATRGAALV
ncbi:flagellar biosynthesis protein FlhF [Sulfuricystis thermophila]|uniref:flagellar biosynthesis protein FlhF n=1 Tax=Sulfuricystis thermophila TaxID=2496847 RepID=UPI0010365075|nr:flagellar biosynthesis protein FlhF [Sulfuricystis thermophila]